MERDNVDWTGKEIEEVPPQHSHVQGHLKINHNFTEGF
jgi:hypothetical protein